MDICLYEDWMKPQIAKLFSMQYGVNEDDFSRLIDNFYAHPFQKGKSIRIVAKEENKIIGFQSFFYWPYIYEGTVVNAYQSGNSLIHMDYRGQGIFQKLLNYLDLHKDQLNIDLVIGFPIDASIGSLLRNKWINIFNLQWFLKMGNPFSLFFPLHFKKLNTLFPNVDTTDFSIASPSIIKLLHTPSFNEWRGTHYDSKNYFSFVHQKGKEKLVLKLKTNIRKKILKELIIGDVITSSYEEQFLEEAIRTFFKTLKKINCITIVSIACNVHCKDGLQGILLKCGFKKLNKQIYFCVKPFTNSSLYCDASKWSVFRGDIDTW